MSCKGIQSHTGAPRCHILLPSLEGGVQLYVSLARCLVGLIDDERIGGFMFGGY